MRASSLYSRRAFCISPHFHPVRRRSKLGFRQRADGLSRSRDRSHAQFSVGLRQPSAPCLWRAVSGDVARQRIQGGGGSKSGLYHRCAGEPSAPSQTIGAPFLVAIRRHALQYRPLFNGAGRGRIGRLGHQTSEWRGVRRSRHASGARSRTDAGRSHPHSAEKHRQQWLVQLHI